ncbi:MAG: hypothetical protein AB7L91_18400 [Dehalococcoidia bacterium]
MRGEQMPLWSGPAPICNGCGVELTDVHDISFSQCFTCNHEEAQDQLVAWLRQEWRDARTEKRRLLCAAWAAHIKGDQQKVDALRPRWEAAQ